MNDAFERRNDAAKNFRDLAADHKNIVDLQENAQAVAFAGELRLVGLRVLEIERVIDGHGDLAGDALHELQLRVRNSLRGHAAEAHRADAALSRGQRKNRHGTDAVFANPRYEVGETRFFVDIGDDQRLLRLPDPAGRMAFDRRFHAGDFFRGDARFENMKTHHVADRIVEDESQEVEFNDGVQAAGKVVEKRGEIALLGDGFADFEQRFELTPGMLEGRGEGDFAR